MPFVFCSGSRAGQHFPTEVIIEGPDTFSGRSVDWKLRPNPTVFVESCGQCSI